MRRAIAVLIFGAALAPAPLRADSDAQVVLRMATVAPDGSPWARELKAFARNVESTTHGHVRIKWYFNGIAGDEEEQEQRIRSGQLDGTAAGEILSTKVAPSMRVRSLVGVFHSSEEVVAVMNQLQPAFEEEAHRAGYVILGTVCLGPGVYFVRRPVHTWDELRRLRMWVRENDPDTIAAAKQVGLQVVPLPLSEAARAFDEGRVDGFVAVPSAALAFQWTVRARYLVDIRTAFILGSLIIAERAFDALPLEDQQAIRSAGASLRERINELGRNIDAQLFGGLLQKQGVTLVPISEAFRNEFESVANQVAMNNKSIPHALVVRVLKTLTDLRAQRGTAAR